MPRCRKCGLEHFNFQSCETARVEAEAERRKDVAPRQVLRKREDVVEGERDWASRHHTMVGVGNRSFYPRTRHPAYEEREPLPLDELRAKAAANDLSYPKFFEE